MKNQIKISLLSLAVFGFASCDMDAPTLSTLDESTMFSTYALAEAEVMSVNVSFGETNSYRGRYLPYYGFNTDVEVGNSPDLSKAGDDNKNDLWNYNTKPTNSQMNTDNNAYAMFYQGEPIWQLTASANTATLKPIPTCVISWVKRSLCGPFSITTW